MLDFYRGTLSPRRLWLLIHHLPVDGALLRRVRPELGQYNWSPDAYVVADFIDIMIALRRGQPGKPYPRPAELIGDTKLQRERFAALEQQAERNRLREVQDTT